MLSLKEKEMEIESLKESFERKAETVKTLESNATFLMNENTVLKNASKVIDKTDDKQKVETIQALSIAMERMEAYTSKSFKRVNDELAENEMRHHIQQHQQGFPFGPANGEFRQVS